MRAAIVAMAVAMAGCATIMAGGPDQVPVATNPPGAYVYVNGQVVGQTPTVVALDRHQGEAQIQIYLPGFQPIVITRDKSLNTWTLANILLGVWPIIIDVIDGDVQEFDNSAISLGLTPVGPAPAAAPPAASGPPGAPPPPPR
jgi:hypothetical protein